MKPFAEFRGFLSGLALVGVGALVAIDGPLLIPGQELLQSLRFHIAAVVLGLMVLLLVSRAWWRAVALLVLVLASVGQGGLVIYREQQSRTAYEGRPLLASARVLSFNVLSGNLRGADIVDYMIQTQPDVAFIMESEGIQSQRGRIGAQFPYFAGCDARGGNCDLMMFSKTPLRGVRVLPLEPFNRLRLVVAETTINGQAVTLVGTHLSKPYFDEAAWVELEQIRGLLASLSGPIILSGDFNAASWSEPVAQLIASSDLVPPPYYPATWPIRFGALGVPIDNMFTRNGARIDAIAAMDDALGSNHRGLLATIGFYALD